MKKILAFCGTILAISGFLLIANPAYAGVPSDLNNLATSLANSLGFTTETSDTGNAYPYSGERGLNAVFTNSQGTLTVEYCVNGANYSTEVTQCASAPNACGMVGTGFVTQVISNEGQLASSNTGCSAQTPSNDLCPNQQQSSTCPNGSSAPNSDPNQCTCAQGNQNACNGTCPTGYTYQSDQCVPSGGNCPIGYAYESGQCVFTSCPSGYVLQSGQCVYADQCTQGLYCSDGNLYNQTIQGGACVGTLDQQCPYGCDSDTLSCNPPPTPQFEQFDAIGPDGSVFTSDGSLTALPTLLPAGLTSNLYWNAEYVEPGSCKVTGTNGDSFLGTDSNVSEGNTNTSGASGVKTGPITSQTIYTLSCTGYDGSMLTGSASINIIPMFNEL